MKTRTNEKISTPPTPLTAKEKAILEFIESYIQKAGVSPSYQEIKDHFGLASFNSIQRYLKQLQKKSYIHIPDGHQKRAISVVQPSHAIQNFMSTEFPNPSLLMNASQQPTTNNHKPSTHLPRQETPHWPPPVTESLSFPLLGRVAAGSPIEAFEHNEFVSAPPGLARNPAKTFALRVEGESMIEDGILDGDIIFVQEQRYASNGDTVVATVDGEATVKRYYTHGPSSPHVPKEFLSEATGVRTIVELRPANSAMKSFWYSQGDVEIRGLVVGLIRTL